MNDGWPLAETPTPPIVWSDFVKAVLAADRFIHCNTVWRMDGTMKSAPETTPPTFEFMGWRVYKPRS